MTQTAEHVAQQPALTGVRQGADVVFRYLAALFFLAVLVQVFLAGAGVFGIDSTDVESAGSFDAHRMLGNILGVVAGVLFILSVVARATRGTWVNSLVLALLTEVAQHGLASAGVHNRWVGGLHAADGVIILLLGGWLALDAWRRGSARR